MMIDKETIEKRIAVVEDDIRKVNQQLTDLDNQKGEATKLLYALDGARQQCVYFLQ